MISIVENTLRDGSYQVRFQLTREDTFNVVKGLDALGFKYIEVGHGLGLGTARWASIPSAREPDQVYIEAAKRAAGQAAIGTFFIPEIGTQEDVLRGIDMGLDFIRVGVDINKFRQARESVEFARSKGLFVTLNFMKSYAVRSYEFSRICREVDPWGADVIYLADSAGCMTPDEVFEYLDRAHEQVQTHLGFHGHNNLSLAVANCLAALKAGATYLDTCMRGWGRSAGNAQTEIVVYLLQKLKLLDDTIDLYDLYDFVNTEIVPLMSRPQGLTDEEIHIGVSRFHSSFLPLVKKTTEAFEGIDQRKLIKGVSDVNCINPGEALFAEIAATLQDTQNAVVQSEWTPGHG